jgi:hypothetical protein
MLEPDYGDPTDEERSEFMDEGTSSDGTQIAFDRLGDSPPVLVGGSSPAWTIDIGRQVADTLPNGKHRVLEGQEHVVPPEVLVPVLAEFFAGRNKPD